MSNRDFREVRKSLETKRNEIVKAHYVGAAVLIAVAAGFLLLVFALDRAFDFSRFAY
jgi:hypothetical protein